MKWKKNIHLCIYMNMQLNKSGNRIFKKKGISSFFSKRHFMSPCCCLFFFCCVIFLWIKRIQLLFFLPVRVQKHRCRTRRNYLQIDLKIHWEQNKVFLFPNIQKIMFCYLFLKKGPYTLLSIKGFLRTLILWWMTETGVSDLC